MPRKRRRISAETAAVLSLFIQHRERVFYGLEVVREAGVPSGSVYPILIRLESQGIFASRLEDEEDAAAEGRRPRRYYRLTDHGARAATEDLDEWYAEERRRAQSRGGALWVPGPTTR
jgi:PadR family transcriptional regulator PadR